MEAESVYITGPISGCENRNREAFARARAWLRATGHVVDCPSENTDRDGLDKPREFHMARDIQSVLNAENVVLLEGWEISPGSLVEVLVALVTGKTLYHFYIGVGEKDGDHVEESTVTIEDVYHYIGRLG